MAAGGHDKAPDGAGAADLLVEPAARLSQAHLRLGQLPGRALGQRRIPCLRCTCRPCHHHASCRLRSLCGRKGPLRCTAAMQAARTHCLPLQPAASVVSVNCVCLLVTIAAQWHPGSGQL